jgi:hypothetical protein
MVELNKGVLRKLQEWRESPLQFVTDCINVTPSEQQIELLMAYKNNKRITVRSGHGCGKDAAVSWIMLHFLTTRPYAKIAATAPTAHQLSDILWTEMSKWLRQSTLADEFVIMKDKIHQKDSKAEWWARAISVSARSSSEEQAETLAGLHADHLLIIVDEASGVPDPVYIPLEGALTQADNKVILIGNMTRNQGYFYDTHFDDALKKDWCRLHWDSRKSTNVDPSMPAYFAMKYGINSNTFRIRVEGNPPLADDETLIPLYAAEQCVGNEFEVADDEPLYLGVDVARYGSDDSVIMPRKGNLIMPWERYNGMNTIELGGFIQQAYQESDAEGCAIDVIGVGAGVADWLQKHHMRNLFMVNVATAGSDIEKYDRLRDELWIRVRDKCLHGLYNFPDIKLPQDKESLGKQLAGELASVRYGFNAHGGIKVESKKELKARGIASPNIADALCLSEYFSNISTKVFKKARTEKSKVIRPWQFNGSRGSGRVRSQRWMAV